MFNSFFKKPAGKTLNLKIEGMHCPSCAMNIDGELEELAGVIKASTNYAKSRTELIIDPTKTSLSAIKKKIHEVGYRVADEANV